MLTSMSRSIRLAAHYAACKVVRYSYFDRRNLLNALEIAGLPRFILDKDENGEITLSPLKSGRIISKNRESWTDWALFSRAEIQSYSDLLEMDLLAPANYTAGAPCPKCGGYVHEDWRGRRCQECGEELLTSGDKEAELIQVLTGWHEYSSGPGRSFAGSPWISRHKGNGKILIKWSGGLDI